MGDREDVAGCDLSKILVSSCPAQAGCRISMFITCNSLEDVHKVSLSNCSEETAEAWVGLATQRQPAAVSAQALGPEQPVPPLRAAG